LKREKRVRRVKENEGVDSSEKIKDFGKVNSGKGEGEVLG